jgi:hypothetical protein
MRAFRPIPLLLGPLFALSVGCSNSGSYRVSWAFNADGMFVVGSCGASGVSAISIAGTTPDGSTDDAIAPCAPGSFTRSLAPGTWTLNLIALDATGHVKEPAETGLLRGVATVSVVEDQLTVVDPVVVLTSLPQCRDGVDNDRDGRVDLDDPDCAGEREKMLECSTPVQPCPDLGP